jgi:hypothetical protein
MLTSSTLIVWQFGNKMHITNFVIGALFSLMLIAEVLVKADQNNISFDMEY